MIKKIAVVGAGTMGAGIAFTAAQNNFEVLHYDLNQEMLKNAEAQAESNLSFLLKKNKIEESEAKQIRKRISYSNKIEDCQADIIIEAIIENLSIKQKLFKQLAEINTEQTILASNTSSLSISEIQTEISHPNRVIGMHFFNPAQVMKLVEVVKGKQTDEQTVLEVLQLCKAIQKTAVICNDAPGFIVNRVARSFYLEAMHQVEKNNIPFQDVDAALENAGFKMGPFKLMDLIGMDVNLAVSTSVYEAFDKAVRFKPSDLQKQKVAEGKLGQKSGEGFYLYNKK